MKRPRGVSSKTTRMSAYIEAVEGDFKRSLRLLAIRHSQALKIPDRTARRIFFLRLKFSTIQNGCSLRITGTKFCIKIGLSSSHVE